MPASDRTRACAACGALGARTLLDNVPLCDRCYNTRVSERTGWPTLPDPPPVEHVRSADGRSIPIRYRLVWSPAGLMAAEAEQDDAPPGEGYRFRELGASSEEPSLVQGRLRAKVRRELSRAYLERDDPDAAWRVVGTEVAGRLDWSGGFDEPLPSVVVDGRRFDWETFGAILAAFEGWEFRLVLGDEHPGIGQPPAGGRGPANDGGQVIPLFGTGHDDPPAETATPSIDDALSAFLAEQGERLAEPTARRYEGIIDLLRACLNAYGYQALTGEAERRWQRAHDGGEAEAFTRVCGPEHIPGAYGEFLGYFMLRKVAATRQQLVDAGTVTKRLARWLADRGYVALADAEAAFSRAAAAARDLPRADALARRLQEVALGTELPDDPDEISGEDWVEDQLPISRVEEGRLWFDGVGPVAVPAEASASAEVGWEVAVVLARIDGTWRLVDVGVVYP